MSNPSDDIIARYRTLFAGLDSAFGHGGGGWVKRPLTRQDFIDHLAGRGKGIGVGPLRPDNTVRFAAIDLDEPNFDLAREFQQWIPGPSFLERSRSGNAHVWVFFDGDCDAWVATGMLKYAIESAGARHVEVFPKQTRFDAVSLGNYINLPYHGDERPIVIYNEGQYKSPLRWHSMDLPLVRFLNEAEKGLNSPADWRKRADWLMITDPALARAERGQSEFGTQRNLHICAEHIIDGVTSGERPITPGHRSVVYFNLAKQLANCEMWTEDETLEALVALAEASEAAFPQPMKPRSELARYVRNAYEKQYTSTGCDDPVFGPYAHPDCPIANPRR